MTMSVGERAEITIQPEWAYGKKGVEGKYPLKHFKQYFCCFNLIAFIKPAEPPQSIQIM